MRFFSKPEIYIRCSYYYIHIGPDQTRPADFAKEMENIKFKEALNNFFVFIGHVTKKHHFLPTKL